MNTASFMPMLARLFSELVDGAHEKGGAFILNTGDVGLLASLDRLSPDEASSSSGGGATIAAHARHLQYGLSLMNRWAREGGNPFADATWEEAWKTSRVDAAEWDAIRAGLKKEAHDWLRELGTPRDVNEPGLGGLVGSIAHLGYHLGAIRQIATRARGPKEGAYSA